jgi:cyclophilin family peptidyl-prolyl cis-trans isomerase
VPPNFCTTRPTDGPGYQRVHAGLARFGGRAPVHSAAVSTTPRAAKRYRKRQNKQAAQAARYEAIVRAKRRRTIIRFAIVAVVIAGVLGVLAFQSSGDKNAKAKTTNTTAGKPTTTAAARLAAYEKLSAAKFTTNCPDSVSAGPKTFANAPGRGIDPKKKYTATMETDLGKITIALDPKTAPITVNSFVFLSCQGFYDGLKFHRVVDDFVIQGGDPQGTGSGGPGYTLPEEPPLDGKYPAGSLAMAKTGAPHSTGSQFFIVTGNPAALESTKTYSFFGKVTEGLDVAKKIEKQHAAGAAGQPFDGPPSPDVHIVKVRITESAS